MTVDGPHSDPLHQATLCRVCGHSLYAAPLHIYENMPKSAQFLPTEEDLPLDNGVTFRVYQCSGCGLVQLNCSPVSYYREVIRAAAVSTEMKDFRLKQFTSFLNEHDLMGKKIVEIGCGHGEYLSLMQQCGGDAFGLEFSPKAVATCIEKKLKVSQGFVDHHAYHLENQPFSAFFMLNFLEHLPDPRASLGGIWHNLNEEGIGLVEVPNFDMILKKNLFSEFVTDHLLYFTRETLTTTLSMSGFEVLDCRTVWHDYILSAHVRKRRRTDLNSFTLQQHRLQDELNAFLSAYTPETAVVWGAGHQALAVLALADLAGKIKFVVDSAPFKQGRYTPATHIKIVPPEALESADIRAIVVMSASYSDEVAALIHKKFGNRIKIAILRDYGLEII